MKLFLCEKPSQAKDIANVLGAKKRNDGFIAGNNFIVTWAFGHILEQAPPDAYDEKYVSWDLATLPILPSKWQLTVKKEAKHQFEVIKKLLKQVDHVVIATDADREGELIAREILEYNGFDGKIERLWLSALDEKSIQDALSKISAGELTYPLYLAGLARSRADWLMGMNLTRLYTILAQKKGFRGVLSVGRVQTPTLNLIVQRDNQIDNFKPVPYYDIELNLSKNNTTFTAQWVPSKNYTDDKNRCLNQSIANQVTELIKKNKSSIVHMIETKRETHSAPLAYDLGTLQQECSSKFGYGAQQVLDIAQSLYEKHKATSYPRTDCGYLPTSMLSEVNAVIHAIFSSDESIVHLKPLLDLSKVSRIWNDKKITAHHGIIPTQKTVDLSTFTTPEINVYKLIKTRYLANFLDSYELDVTKLQLNCSGQLFATSGKIVVNLGWKTLYIDSDKADTTDNLLPKLAKGDSCIVIDSKLKSLMTKAPDRFTEGTLISAMKNAAQFVTDPDLKKRLKDTTGLATEATRAGIIETLLNRGFIEKKKKNLQSTTIGKELIALLPDIVKDPGMTALWEQSFDDIASNRLTLQAFMNKQNTWTARLIENTKGLDLNITVAKTPACPKCKSLTILRKNQKKSFYGCSNYPACDGILNI